METKDDSKQLTDWQCSGSKALLPFSFKAAQLNPINDDLPFVVGAFEERGTKGELQILDLRPCRFVS